MLCKLDVDLCAAICYDIENQQGRVHHADHGRTAAGAAAVHQRVSEQAGPYPGPAAIRRQPL